MKLFALIEKYLALAVVGVHAAASVPAATNSDKRSAVLTTVIAVADAIASAPVADPKVQLIGAMVDVIATVINKLTTPTQAPVAPAPVNLGSLAPITFTPLNLSSRP